MRSQHSVGDLTGGGQLEAAGENPRRNKIARETKVNNQKYIEKKKFLWINYYFFSDCTLNSINNSLTEVLIFSSIFFF